MQYDYENTWLLHLPERIMDASIVHEENNSDNEAMKVISETNLQRDFIRLPDKIGNSYIETRDDILTF